MQEWEIPGYVWAAVAVVASIGYAAWTSWRAGQREDARLLAAFAGAGGLAIAVASA
ncbi:MAG: hypothetical protein HY856_10375 [Burkholderiales bacterium]|nr:hypothetical protein [Burkholderiales bacterium]